MPSIGRKRFTGSNLLCYWFGSLPVEKEQTGSLPTLLHMVLFTIHSYIHPSHPPIHASTPISICSLYAFVPIYYFPLIPFLAYHISPTILHISNNHYIPFLTCFISIHLSINLFISSIHSSIPLQISSTHYHMSLDILCVSPSIPPLTYTTFLLIKKNNLHFLVPILSSISI